MAKNALVVFKPCLFMPLHIYHCLLYSSALAAEHRLIMSIIIAPFYMFYINLFFVTFLSKQHLI